MEPLRWGVLGVSESVGRLAVLPALQVSPTAELIAIGSRSYARARAEADVFDAPRAYDSYADLIADPYVDAVYIVLPNALHFEWTIRAVRAGKHVLCEKPLACTRSEATRMVSAAEDAGVVLLEAYMTAYHPRTAALIKLARDGALGALRSAYTAFGFPLIDPANYRWRPEMGGGSLLDVGIYCLAPLLAAAGREPKSAKASAVWTPSGVDASFDGWLDFGDGFNATFHTSFEMPEHQVLWLAGTEGIVQVERAFTPTLDDTEIHVQQLDGTVEAVATAPSDPYLAMVEQFAAIVRGEAESPHPLSTTLEVLRVLDHLRTVSRHA